MDTVQITHFVQIHWAALTLLSIGCYGVVLVFRATVWALARR